MEKSSLVLVSLLVLVLATADDVEAELAKGKGHGEDGGGAGIPWFGADPGGFFGHGGGFHVPAGIGGGWGAGFGGPSGGYARGGVVRPSVVCSEKGPCYKKRVTCPDRCFTSFSRSGKGYGGGGGGGGCTIDCEKRCQKKRHVQPARPVHEGAAPSAGPRTRLLRAQHEQLRRPHGVRAGARVPPAGVSAEKLQPSSVDEKQRQRRGPEAAHTCRVAETRPLSVSGPWHATATAGGAAEPKRGDREDRRGQALRIRGREGWGGLVVAEEPELCSRKTEEGEVVSLMDHVAKCPWK
ncbi:hypothetical protein B296_00035422 [Ensete ventricosum]|uniref:Uncharacterized protein n=1 Tax=Ensete ventricosum TaxID=4639 RepID=A0A427A5W1_ENSVE|nr:hypothetical protein B296_00035422 [Ensete ventricosum]